MELTFKNVSGSWMLTRVGKRRVSSPSDKIEILGYLLKFSMIRRSDWREEKKCLSNIQPIVKTWVVK